MNSMTLTEMGQRLLELRATKDALEAQTKENNAAIEALKQDMAQQMVDDDTPAPSGVRGWAASSKKR